mgnify:CR=1 FL=1
MKKLIEKFKSLFSSKKVEEEIKVKPKEIKIAKKKVKTKKKKAKKQGNIN